MLIAVLGIAFSAQGQTRVSEVTPDAYIGRPSYVYMGGTTADTLKNADTLEFVIRIKGDYKGDFKIQVYNDYVSGTAGGKFKTYQSIDGITYTVTAAADSITVAALGADALDSEVISLDGYLSPYLKLYYTQSGTAVTVPRFYIYTKDE